MPRKESDEFARGRDEAHVALDRLLDSIRDGRVEFGRAILEITFQNALPRHRRSTLERTERVGDDDKP
jgi:hypothetical protein